MFERGLRQDIFQFIRSCWLQTLDTYMERDAVILVDKDLPPGASSREKRLAPNDGGQTSS